MITEIFTNLFGNVAVIGLGMVLAILGMILALTRSVTNNEEHYPILFASFAWLIALTLPSMIYSGFIFAIGAFTLSFAFDHLLNRLNQPSILIIAVIVALINVMLGFGIAAQTMSWDWQTNYEQAYTDIQNTFGTQQTTLTSNTPDTGLCPPNSQSDSGTTCKSGVTTDTFNPSAFVPFATILAIASYIVKTVAFIGMCLFAPLVLSYIITVQGFVVNPIIALMMGIVINLWQMIIFYHLIRWINNPQYKT